MPPFGGIFIVVSKVGRSLQVSGEIITLKTAAGLRLQSISSLLLLQLGLDHLGVQNVTTGDQGKDTDDDRNDLQRGVLLLFLFLLEEKHTNILLVTFFMNRQHTDDPYTCLYYRHDS